MARSSRAAHQRVQPPLAQPGAEDDLPSWGYPGIWPTPAHGPPYNADFRGAKSTHIPHRRPHYLSRNKDALCEVIFHPIDPKAAPLLRGHHLIIASKSQPFQGVDVL